MPTTLQEKLYGPVDALQKTTKFVEETETQVQTCQLSLFWRETNDFDLKFMLKIDKCV